MLKSPAKEKSHTKEPCYHQQVAMAAAVEAREQALEDVRKREERERGLEAELATARAEREREAAAAAAAAAAADVALKRVAAVEAEEALGEERVEAAVREAQVCVADREAAMVLLGREREELLAKIASLEAAEASMKIETQVGQKSPRSALVRQRVL